MKKGGNTGTNIGWEVARDNQYPCTLCKTIRRYFSYSTTTVYSWLGKYFVGLATSYGLVRCDVLNISIVPIDLWTELFRDGSNLVRR